MKKVTHWTNLLRHAKIYSFFKRLSASCQGKAAHLRLDARFALSALPWQDAEGVSHFS